MAQKVGKTVSCLIFLSPAENRLSGRYIPKDTSFTSVNAPGASSPAPLPVCQQLRPLPKQLRVIVPGFEGRRFWR